MKFEFENKILSMVWDILGITYKTDHYVIYIHGNRDILTVQGDMVTDPSTLTKLFLLGNTQKAINLS